MAIFFVLFYLIVFEWYPSYYFFIDGGIRGILTIFFVDVILGPGLTLFLFKPGKPGLKFDMTMVILFQLSALIWGVNNVYTERPSLTVFYNGQFNCLNQEDALSVDMEKVSLGDNPVLTVLFRPDHIDDYLNMMYEAMGQGSGEIHYFGKDFRPVDDEAIEHILKFKLTVDKDSIRILRVGESVEVSIAQWENYLEDHPGALENFRYYPLDCRFGKALAVFDPETKKIVDTISIFTKSAKAEINKELDVMDIIIDGLVTDVIGSRLE
jgi:hypothetical protein